MRNIQELIINKVIIHVLDRENNNLILSGGELELNEDIYSYFEKHILKTSKSDDARLYKFEGENNIVKQLCSEILENEDSFITNSCKLSQYLYKCLCNDEKETSGDFAVVLFDTVEGMYIALLKLNFTNAYSHYINNFEDNPRVSIGVNNTGLPGIGQKVSKAALIKIDDDSDILVLDNDTEGIFINAFLRCGYVRDRRENTKTIIQTAERFARRAFKNNAQEAEQFRNKFTEALRNEDSFDIVQLAEQSLPETALVNEFKAALLNEGITEETVLIDREWAEKKLQRKRLKVDKSIELYIDVEAYQDKDKFQIKRNGDGTIDIILKNIKNYIEK